METTTRWEYLRIYLEFNEDDEPPTCQVCHYTPTRVTVTSVSLGEYDNQVVQALAAGWEPIGSGQFKRLQR